MSNNEPFIDILRHDTAHVLAMAVQELFPDAQVTIGPVIENGLCIAIEPMVNMGSFEVYTKKDNWTISTADGLPSAHFEHSIAFFDDKVKILTI